MFDRFSIHQINAPNSCCYLSKVLLQKRGMGNTKVIHKKEKKKWTQKYSRYIKQWVLRCLPEKKEKKEKEEEKNKIAPVL
jgi:hypothetical protein